MFQQLVSRPDVFLATIFLLSLVALSPSPEAGPLVLLLTALQSYIKTTDHAFGAVKACFACTLGVALAYLTPSTNALSSPMVSWLILLLLSCLSSFVSIVVIYLGTHYAENRSTWFTLTLFPVLWASVWEIVSLISPVGRLVTWSPVTSATPYSWTSQYLGPLGIDFLIAAWSVILVEAASSLVVLLDPPDLMTFDSATDQNNQPSTPPPSKKLHVLALGTILILLAVPSYITRYLPLPSFTTETTPFIVGCALPRTRLPDGRYSPPTAKDYIAESRKMTAATIIMWPEGAVKFETHADREWFFGNLSQDFLFGQQRLYLGIGFEEYDSSKDGTRTTMKRNGFVLVNHKDGIVLEYYKRHLVPIAESFLMAPSTTPPSVYTIPLGTPSYVRKLDWAPPPDYVRPIPVTTSICLDFAFPSSFTSLESKPSLILAPARTWDKSVGLAMFHQGKQRAHETGATVVWCDGGEGGLSGVIGNGYNEPLQVGDGSWVKMIGIPYPSHENRAFFTRIGGLGALFVLWTICSGGWIVDRVSEDQQRKHLRSLLTYRRAVDLAHVIVAWRNQRRPTAASAEMGRGEQETLISVD